MPRTTRSAPAAAQALAIYTVHHQHAEARWLHDERAYDRRYGVREALRRRDEGDSPCEEDYLAQGRRAAAEEMLETCNPS